MNNGGLNIEVKGITDTFQLSGFILKEELGGKLAEGSISVTVVDRSSENIDISDIKVSLSDHSGFKLTFDAYVYEVNYSPDGIKFSFVCSTKNFTREIKVKSYKSIIKAIKSNWNGKIEYPAGSDVECSIHQRSETGYQLVSKMIKCLRYNAAYGFRCDGIIICDLDNNMDLDLGEQGLSITTSSLTLPRSKIKDLEVKTEEIGVCSSVSYSKAFKQVRTEYVEMYRNYLKNNSIFQVGGAYRVAIQYARSMPNINIGQKVKHKLNKMENRRYIVSKKLTSWSPSTGVVCNLELMGYDWESA